MVRFISFAASFARVAGFLLSAALIIEPARAAIISGTSSDNYVILYGPTKTFAPAVGTKTQTNTFAVSPAPSTGELVILNGNGDNLSLMSCSGLSLIPKLLCLASNVVMEVRIALERPASVEVSLNGQVVMKPAQLERTAGKFVTSISLKASNQIVVKVKGSIFSSVTVTVRGLDYVPPVLTLTSPSANQVIESLSLDVSGISNETLSSVKARLGSDADVSLAIGSSGKDFSGTVLATANGLQTLTVTGKDSAGNESVVTRPIMIQHNQKPSASLNLASSGTGAGPFVVLFDASASSDPDGDALNFKFDFGDGESVVSTFPKISHEFKTAGTYSVEVTVRDPSGASSVASVEVSVTNPALPPRPEDIATPLVQNAPQSMQSIVGFIYSGSNPIQKDVVQSALVPDRVSLVRGKVLDGDGHPLAGVKVTVLNRPELGYTLSREDGMYDLAANAGGPITLAFSRNGYGSANRNFATTIQEMYSVETVALTRLDSKVTQLTVNAPEIQVARASTVSDRDGERTATLSIPKETVATLRMANGTVRNVSTLAVRMTEYTVGESGPMRMPAALPPRTGYTYAINLQADEAIANSAESVEFSKPVAFYVDNFLGVRAGISVPLGYLNQKTGYWEAQPDGVVISVLTNENGLAQLDLGAGRAATVAELGKIGIDEEEQRKLATLYAPGKSFWRVQTNHFSSFDLNFQNVANNVKDTTENRETDKSVKKLPCTGCEIDLVTRTMKEKLPLPGTPYSLVYTTDKSGIRNASSTLALTLLGDTVPPRLVGLTAEVAVGGKTTDLGSFAIAPSAALSFTWDGKDAYGRSLNGITNARVRVRYEYWANYELSMFDPDGPRTFGTYNRGISIEIMPARWRYVIVRDYDIPLRPPEDLATKLAIDEVGKWTFSNHHFLDVKGKEIYFGDGSSQQIDKIPKIVNHVAGNGTVGFAGDGGLASAATLNLPRNIKIDNQGNILVAEVSSHRIRKIDRVTGIISTIAGTGSAGFSGDGGLATLARFNQPQDLFVDRDDNIYVTDYLNHRVRKIDKGGTINTIAGTGVIGYSGDNGPATLAQINTPRGIVVNNDGSVYFSENDNHTIRRIDPSGIITTVAGSGRQGHTGDGGLATEAELNFPNYTAFDSRGNLYVAESGVCMLRKISVTGIITTVAGTGVCGYNGDGELAIKTQLNDIAQVAVAPDDTIYIADRSNHRIRAIDGSGRINTIIGTGTAGYNGYFLGGSATQVNFPTDVEVRGDGSLVFVDRNNSIIREYVDVQPFLTNVAGEIMYASADGSEFYVFDQASGRHLRTRYSLTGGTKYAFEYNQNGHLTAIVDANNNRTQIERGSGGAPSAIVAPRGQRFALSLGSSGGLEQITMPTGETYSMRYNELGLMSQFKKPKGNETNFEYDPFGYLIKETDAGGGYQTFGFVSGGTRVRKTRLGDTTSIFLREDAHANLDVVTMEGDKRSTETTYSNGFSIGMSSAGTKDYSERKNDQRLRGLATYGGSGASIYPDGTRDGFVRNRTYTFGATTGSLFNFTSADYTNHELGWTNSYYDSGSKTYIYTTSAGRNLSSIIDDKERTTYIRNGQDEPIQFAYHPTGEIAAITQGSRTTQFSYDENGFLNRITDALGRTQTMANDSSGRILASTNAASETSNFGYDLNGNLEKILLPGNILHELASGVLDLFVGYRDPSGGSIGRTYDYDKNLTSIMRKDGKNISLQNLFIDGGRRRLTGISMEADQINFAYMQFDSIWKVTSNSGTVGYIYNGELPILRVVETTTQSYKVSYGDGALVSSHTVTSSSGTSSVPVTYNSDRQIASVGAMTIGRTAADGRISSMNVGGIAQSFAYNTYGEISQTVASSSAMAFAEYYDRDALGRIVSKQSVGDGLNRFYAYSYDLAGRLAKVETSNGFGTPASTTEYSYDARGNRTSVIRNGSITSSTFDSEDRLLSSGDMRFAYSPDGEMIEKRNLATNEVTTYSYDQLGHLLSVKTPLGKVISYTLDGERNRVARLENGVMKSRYIYDFSGRMVAELSPNSQLISHFVYTTQSHSPDLMIKGGVTYRFLKDQLGSIRQVVNSVSGTIAQSITYDEFGRVLGDTSPGFQPFGFAGGIYDFDTGLVKFGVRSYDAEIGRWTSKDPILFEGRQANLFVYANNDPINKIDSDGRFPKSIEEAGECLLGNIEAILFQRRSEITYIKSKLERVDADMKSSETQCGGPKKSDLKIREKALRELLDIRQAEVDKLVNQCSWFPTID